MRKYILPSEWNTHIKNWKESGESQREYCRVHHINLWTFRNHLKKDELKAGTRFTELHVKTSSSELIRIEVKDKFTIVLPGTANEKTIAKIIAAIEEAECSSTGRK
jgi:hypothetical protein